MRIFCLVILSLSAAVAYAKDTQPFAKLGEETSAPTGWVTLCAEYKGFCDTKPSAPLDIELTPEVWAKLVKVNDFVNQSVKQMSDLDHWGIVERWNFAEDGYGDTEDFVLLKRRMLINQDLPREALLVTVVRDKIGDSYAVLTVKTNKGEFVLDDRETRILLWSKTGYRFIKRQSQGDPNAWVLLEPAKGTARKRK